MSLHTVGQIHGLPIHRVDEDGVTLAWVFTDGLDGDLSERIDALLSTEEQDRAAAHRQAGDRASYRAAQALKRLILADWLDCSPDSLAFARTPRGKPYLADRERLQFSLSHCAGLAAFACATDRRVGVDAERTDSWPFDAATAQIAFHPAECAVIATLPEADRPAARYDLWMLREAHAKATGAGLADQPGPIAFALDPPRILHGIRQDEPWTFSLRRAGLHHSIALATS